MVLSLGGLCQVALQIEKRFGFRYSSPFDWLVTPLASVAKVLSDGGNRFGVAVKTANAGQAPVCANYGLSYHHEFVRDESKAVIIDTEGLERTRGKLTHKYSRMSELVDGKKTLFVRLAGHNDGLLPTPYAKDVRATKAEDLNAMAEGIQKAFPALDFEIAFVHIPDYTTVDIGPGQLDPRIRVFEIENTPSAGWEGAPESWAPIFDSYTFDLTDERGRARQFSRRPQEREGLYR
jgi:hypothetical protein